MVSHIESPIIFPKWVRYNGSLFSKFQKLTISERVRLLVHILCELRDSRGITVAKLREADQSIRRQISPPDRLGVLDEIYRVREEEESYLDNRLGT
jgi:hypothetical protein